MTDEHASSVMGTDNVEQHVSNSMKDFKSVSLMVPDGDNSALPCEEVPVVAMARIKNASKPLPTKNGDKNKPCKQNMYDEVLPNKGIILQISRGEFPSLETRKCDNDDSVFPYEGASSIGMAQIKNVSELPPAKMGMRNKSHKQNVYDEVLPTKGVILQISEGEHLNDEAGKSGFPSYSMVQPHAMVLSNHDIQAQGKHGSPNHTYHLLEGSNPNEQGVVKETGESTSMVSMCSSEQFLKNFGSNKIAQKNLLLNTTTEGDIAHNSRRTTLSYFPTGSNIFDDPTYENIKIDTATSCIARESRCSNIYGQEVKGKLRDLPAVPTRTRSLVVNRNEQKSQPTKEETTIKVVGLCKDGEVASGTVKSPSPQVSSNIFDDPKYDKGLNLSESGQ